MKSMSIKTKLIAIPLASMLILGIALYFLITNSYQNFHELIAKEDIRSAENAFKNLEKNDINKLSSTLQAILSNRHFKEAFMAKEREKLYALASPLFEELKKNYNITHWYFHNPEPKGTVFLRVHDPEKYNDPVGRVTYRESVKSKGFSSGKELGATAFALRVVHPYFANNGKLIGYMELGEEIDHFFEIMKGETSSEYGLFIDKKFLDQRQWELLRKTKGLRNNWADRKDILLVDSTSKQKDVIKIDVEMEKIPDGGRILGEIEDGKNYFISGIYPVYDAAQVKVGGMSVLRNITFLHDSVRATVAQVILIIAIILVISLLASYFVSVSVTKPVTKAVEVLMENSTTVSSSSAQLSQGSTEQAGSVEEITSAITELSAQSRQSAINAGEITDISQKTLQNAEDGLKKITSMVISINDISESSKSIAKIMKTIDEIAFQTNLLALNAAVEAARAGRHGKGFAVVAEEVNNLSKRSSLAAKETADIIESSLKKIEEGKSITEDTQGAFQKILQGIQEVNKLNEEIAQATIQQVKGIEQVESGIQEIDKVTQQNASIAEENAAACGELSQQSQALYNVVSSADSKENNDKFETADNGRLHRIASGGNNHGKNYYKDRRTDEKYHLRENTRRHLIEPSELISLEERKEADEKEKIHKDFTRFK